MPRHPPCALGSLTTKTNGLWAWAWRRDNVAVFPHLSLSPSTFRFMIHHLVRDLLRQLALAPSNFSAKLRILQRMGYGLWPGCGMTLPLSRLLALALRPSVEVLTLCSFQGASPATTLYFIRWVAWLRNAYRVRQPSDPTILLPSRYVSPAVNRIISDRQISVLPGILRCYIHSYPPWMQPDSLRVP